MMKRLNILVIIATCIVLVSCGPKDPRDRLKPPTISEPCGSDGRTVISPDGKWIVSSHADNEIIIWDAATLKQVKAYKAPHKLGIMHMAFTADGTLLTTDHYMMRAWEVPNGNEKIAIAAGVKYVETEGMSMNMSTGKTKFTNLISLKGTMLQMEVSKDGKYVATVTETTSRAPKRTCKVWNIETGKLYKEFPKTHKICFSTDGSKLLTVGRGSSAIYDFPSLNEISNLDGLGFTSDSSLGKLAFDGNTIAFYEDLNRSVGVYDSSGKLKYSIDKLSAHQLFISGNRLFIKANFFKQDVSFKCYAIDTGAVIWEKDGIRMGTLSPNGKYYVSSTGDARVSIYDLDTGEKWAEAFHDDAYFADSLVSPDGKSIITMNDGRMFRWDFPSD